MDGVINFHERPETISKHLYVLTEEYLSTNEHEFLDRNVLTELENDGPEVESLRHPATPEDYVAFVRLVAAGVYGLVTTGQVEPSLKALRVKLTDDFQAEPWSELRRLVDECLKEERFKQIRNLAEFWPTLGVSRLRWYQITDYPHPEYASDTDSEAELETNSEAETDPDSESESEPPEAELE